VPYLPLVDALRVFPDAELPPVLEHWRRGEAEPAATQPSPDIARVALSETAIAESEALGFDLRRGAMNRNNASEALFAIGRWDEAIAQADTVRNRIEFRFAGRMAMHHSGSSGHSPEPGRSGRVTVVFGGTRWPGPR
jgi:hypothetical protein